MKYNLRAKLRARTSPASNAILAAPEAVKFTKAHFRTYIVVTPQTSPNLLKYCTNASSVTRLVIFPIHKELKSLNKEIVDDQALNRATGTKFCACNVKVYG